MEPASRHDLPNSLEMEYLTRLEINVDDPVEVGNTYAGRRRVVPILGGTAHGPALSGAILPAGADFQVIRSPTVSDLDARYIIEAESGDRIFVSNQAYRTGSAEDIAALAQGIPVPPERIYFRCSPRFEVAGEDLKWLESTVVVGAGVRTPNAVMINLWSIL